MEIYKLLNRFELLYNHDDRLADLRRCYIDKDLNSIFRLSDTNEDLRKAIIEKNLHSIFRLVENKRIIGEIEDLRKAVIENNLHSLFRLLPGTDDLRKAVIDENIHSIFRLINNKELKGLVLNNNYHDMWRLLEKYTNSQFVYAFKTLLEKNINFDEDSFSQGQIKSKQWLVKEVKNLDIHLGTVFLCAGWYGTLATMLFESGIHMDKIRSFDIDPDVWKIAEIFNKKWVVDNWKFKSSVQDIHDIDFSNDHVYRVYKSNGEEELLWDTPDTIINTSCEHIDNFDEWYEKIPSGKLIILQNNNYFEVEEHINCKKSLDDFSKQTPMDHVLYEGELDLILYKRFMRIGFK